MTESARIKKRQRKVRRTVAAGDASARAVAERLRLTRLGLARARKISDLPQAEFYRLAGISSQAGNNYEQGARRIQLDQAIKLCDAHRLTLDWIYRNEPSGLPYDIQVAIADLRAKAR
jgi:DNA-binding XRE family transcriptional regulator